MTWNSKEERSRGYLSGLRGCEESERNQREKRNEEADVEQSRWKNNFFNLTYYAMTAFDYFQPTNEFRFSWELF